MYRNKELEHVAELLTQRKLLAAIDSLENYMLSRQMPTDTGLIADVKEDYRLMSTYWQRGFDDPQRAEVYGRLLSRVYVVTANMLLTDRIRQSAYMRNTHQRPRSHRTDWSLTAIRAQLENYVSESALLQLEPEHTRHDKEVEINRQHAQLMNDLFDYIVTTKLWKDSLTETFLDMLLTPTVSSLDQQLIVSAVTMSGLICFGINKFTLLLNVYRRTTDRSLRQRALVGWVLCADERMATIYPEMKKMVAEVCQDDACCQELTELQMQLLFSCDAETDGNTIINEIMPDLLKGSRVRMTRKGLEEQEENLLDEILHPEAAEQDMERMEQRMHQMMDMQKKGSDIYFGGFRQMKRFPFFHDLAGWFVPFYPEHPAISPIWENTRGKKFLQAVTRVGAFCDSDQYSFVLAFSHVLDRIPQTMLDMIDKGEATPMPIGGELPSEEREKPAFARRMYLQDIYRFCRLFQARSEFPNVFESADRLAFFCSPLFRGTGLEKRFCEIAAFLLKRGMTDAAVRVLDNFETEPADYQYLMLKASFAADALEYYRRALGVRPADMRAQKGIARELFAESRFEEAYDIYLALHDADPDNRTLLLSMATCQANMGQHKEAQETLYKLVYLYPDYAAARRILAWTLTETRQFDQADQLYRQLLQADVTAPDDRLNHAYCLWFAGRVGEAVDSFRRYRDDCGLSRDDVATLLDKERQRIDRHGIGDTEMQLMRDAVSQ